METWYWVSTGSTSVDTAELVAASGHISSAAQSATTALTRMAQTRALSGFSAPSLGHWLAMSHTASGPLIADLRLQARGLDTEANIALVELRDALQTYSDWLAQAALIYATAEEGAAGFSRTCRALEGTGCLSAVSDTSGTVAAWGDLAMALPAYIGEFRGRSAATPAANLSAQNQILITLGGEGKFTQDVVAVAKWWSDVGAFVAGESRGVLVAGPNGDTLWVSASLSALGLPALQPELRGSRKTRMREAFARLEKAQMQRRSPSRTLLRAGGRVAPTPDTYTAGSGSIVTPMSSAALLSRIAASGATATVGEVQIIKHTGVSGSVDARSWTVVIRGTRTWAPGSLNPQDMQSNLEEVAGKPSDQKAAVEAAMQMAGIEKGEPVEIVGHSQGGAVALDIASDTRLAKKYDVVAVLTAGAPTGGFTPRDDVSVLNYENLSDIVPALDGSGPKGGKNVSTAYFDARGLQVPEGASAHSLDTYVKAAVGIEAAAASNPMASQIAAWNTQRASAMGFGSKVSSEVQYYRTTRVR